MIIWSIILMQPPWRSAWKGSGVDKQVLILPRIKLCRTFWVPSTRMSPQHPTYRFCLVERSTIHFCQKDFVTDIREVYLSPRSHFQVWSLAHEIYRASKLGASIDQHRGFIRSNLKKAHVLGWLAASGYWAKLSTEEKQRNRCLAQRCLGHPWIYIELKLLGFEAEIW